MSALAFNFEEITARALKPALTELDGISRETIESHYKLYEGYVAKRNEILRKLADVDASTANQTYSEIRELKVELTFAVGGIKNHEIYFEHLGGDGGDPSGVFGELVERDFGSVDAWRERPAGDRPWAPAAGPGRPTTGTRAASTTTSATPRTRSRSGTRLPLVALDVYEHAYFLDYRTDRAAYVQAFFDNLDWSVVERVGRGVRHQAVAPCSKVR